MESPEGAVALTLSCHTGLAHTGLQADGDVVTCMESLKLVVITIKKRNRDSKPDITEYPEITEGRDGV